MDRMVELYLRGISRKLGVDSNAISPKNAQDMSILDNPMISNMVDGALKALEYVAIFKLDWKLTAIVKLLQSWLEDKKEERDKLKKQLLHGIEQAKPTTSYEFNTTYY